METYEALFASIEAFLAGLQEDEMVLYGLSMQDQEDLLPYIGLLCGDDYP